MNKSSFGSLQQNKTYFANLMSSREEANTLKF